MMRGSRPLRWLVRAAPCALAALAGCAGPAEPESAPAPSDAAPACEEGDPARERYGADCLCCHRDDFGVAGSIADGARVARLVIHDAAGRTLEMTPNAYGNFFRHVRVTPPLRVAAFASDGAEAAMRADAPDGACNACHRPGGVAPRVGSAFTR